MDQFVGKLDKYFLLSCAFPCLFFIMFNLAFEYFDLLPFGLLLLLSKLGLHLGIVVVLITAFFMGLFLASLNLPITMLYEGYPFRTIRFLFVRQRQKWYRLHNRLEQLMREYEQLPAESDYYTPQAVNMRREITALTFQATVFFPPEPDSLLPTRLGNVIQAFEERILILYGIPASFFWIAPFTPWTRFLPVLPTQFLDQLAELSASFYFLLNITLLLQVLTSELFVVSVYQISPSQSLIGVIIVAISYLLYRLAVTRAVQWSFLLGIAFDLFRRDVLEKYGFDLPSTMEEERLLWHRIWLFTMHNVTEGLSFKREKLEKKEASAPDQER